MRLLIQRVNHASVKVDGEVIGNIGKGFLVLVGIGQNDTREIADKYMKKMLGLRIFEDENGKTNLSLADVNGELLMVSQFTLYANCKKGNRPSFIEAGAPEQANELYVHNECSRTINYILTFNEILKNAENSQKKWLIRRYTPHLDLYDKPEFFI